MIKYGLAFAVGAALGTCFSLGYWLPGIARSLRSIAVSLERERETLP